MSEVNNTMLYKYPGPHDVHGGKFDHVVVLDEEIPAHLASGWHKTTTEAKAAHEAVQAKRAASVDDLVSGGKGKKG